VRRAPALVVALTVLVVAGLGLTLTHHAAPAPLPARVAVRDALRDPLTRRTVTGAGWTRATASPVDSTLERVSFFAGGQIVAEVAVNRDGTVSQMTDFTRRSVPYGNWLAYTPGVLLGVSVLFVLMAGVVPLLRIRNLDVLAGLSFVVPAVLLQHRYLDASVVAALPGLVYLMLRCAWVGLGRRPTAPAASTPLFEHLTSGLDGASRVRVLRVLAVAMALVFVMVGVSSPDPVDVIYAVMEGATKLIHGVLPYEHMPGDVVHSDTYPILSYVAYTPLAALSPVSSTWDSVDLALGAAVAATLAGAGALFRAVAGAARAGASPRTREAEAAGLRAALIWLSFPALLITVSTGTTDVVLAVLLLFAVLLWRRPDASCAMLAVAGWFKLAPFALVPIWLAPLRGRRLLTGLAGLAGVSLAMVALLVGFGGTGGPAAMVHALAFQFSRGSPQSLWTVLGVGWLQPLAQAGALALIAGATVRLWRHPELAADRVRIAALAAAVLLALQLVAAYWAFLYIAWVAPLMAVSVLAEPAPHARRTEARAPQAAGAHGIDGQAPRTVPGASW
jgi:hypothetical protein